MAVLDASVYVALLRASEPAYARCWDWVRLTRESGERLHAPALLLPEVAAAISRGSQKPLLARRVADLLSRSALIELVGVSSDLAGRAASIAADHRLRGSDAVYVALAEELSQPLVTLDRQQLERGSAVVTAREP